jgi:hypothetical protein
MKIIVAIFLSLLISCKKDIHCNCKKTTTQYNKDTVEYFYVTVKKTTIRHASKTQCSNYKIRTEPGINQKTTEVECILK